MSMIVPRPRDPLVRETLVSTSSRLHSLWEEAATRVRGCPPVSAERSSWDAAAHGLLDAMQAVERLAGSMDPGLGRRDWRARCDGASPPA